ncbi:MAG: hypothetical protein R3324_17420, partial [Halobacteriales archaeon]|nr:hypothetical protein [Halobacteriales archaeon]
MTDDSKPDDTGGTRSSAEPPGLISTVDERLPISVHTLLGWGLICLGTVLLLGGGGSYAYGTPLNSGSAQYWLAIEAAYGMAFLGVPLVLAGTTGLLEGSRRMVPAVGLGS